MPPRERSEERAAASTQAHKTLTAPPETIDAIRLNYRFAKVAEQSRIRIDLGLYAYARVFFSGWHPGADEARRKKAAAQAKRVVDQIRDGKEPSEAEAPLYRAMFSMVSASAASWDAFEGLRAEHRKAAEKLAVSLPGWKRIEHVKGFGLWGLVAIIGEAGDPGNYSGCRKLFKRLGLAPDECYPTGERSGGRMVPRTARGRIMGIIADPLLRAQWRGAKDDEPGYPIGPFGSVYAEAKARHLSAGKSKGHADKAARRAMAKALLHDVHAAWHDRPLLYAVERKLAA